MSKVVQWFRKKVVPTAKAEVKNHQKEVGLAQGDGLSVESVGNNGTTAGDSAVGTRDEEQRTVAGDGLEARNMDDVKHGGTGNGQNSGGNRDLFDQDLKKFLSFDIGTIAKDLTLKDWYFYKNIKRQDIDESKSSDIVQQMNYNHKQIYLWTLDTILSGTTAKTRSKVIVQFLRVASALLVHNDLNASHAIVSALQNFAVFRLDKSWKKLSSNKKKLFQDLKKLFSDDDDNYFQLSVLMQDIQAVNNVFIPYLALFLRDFENLQYLQHDRRLLTIRRNRMIWNDINNLHKFQSDSAQPKSKSSYWTISEDKKCLIETGANERSRLLEPPKRFYKLMSVSEINLDEY